MSKKLFRAIAIPVLIVICVLFVAWGLKDAYGSGGVHAQSIDKLTDALESGELHLGSHVMDAFREAGYPGNKRAIGASKIGKDKTLSGVTIWCDGRRIVSLYWHDRILFAASVVKGVGVGDEYEHWYFIDHEKFRLYIDERMKPAATKPDSPINDEESASD